ncbi:DUF2064 domain-containing protein [Luteimicrobium xylanilyticum]|uniref:2-phospho-L-lactate guanylyltransferase n=1 Tax=Luteimicrobium xylanilyticum TaxID=1133546 RepID=A0A5P9QGE7_9MICO|nr:DUF2064 domain-containing protein [Luteimicrobium xylanilyticum]QFV00091.1 hypothetical protein KDY119_03626 [Luteimicrobium xylanilyticum]
MTALVVVAKECLPGLVKTRLCPPLAAVEAASVAAACLADTLAVLAEVPAGRRILYLGRSDGGRPGGAPRPALPGEAAGWEVLRQPGGPLDVRLGGLLDRLDEPFLLVGMDTPQVTAAHLAPALEALATPAGGDRDAWLGPAADGGYWALGLGGEAPRAGRRGDLVRGVPMSRDDTGERQRERLERAGLRVRLLDELVDVDTVDDLRAVAGLAPGSRVARVAAGLGSLGPVSGVAS